jgi:hypothetical protein
VRGQTKLPWNVWVQLRLPYWKHVVVFVVVALLLSGTFWVNETTGPRELIVGVVERAGMQTATRTELSYVVLQVRLPDGTLVSSQMPRSEPIRVGAQVRLHAHHRLLIGTPRYSFVSYVDDGAPSKPN